MELKPTAFWTLDQVFKYKTVQMCTCAFFFYWIITANKSSRVLRKRINKIFSESPWSQDAETWQWTFMLAQLADSHAALHYGWRASLPSWAFDETSSTFLSSLLVDCESCELVSSLIKNNIHRSLKKLDHLLLWSHSFFLTLLPCFCLAFSLFLLSSSLFLTYSSSQWQ